MGQEPEAGWAVPEDRFKLKHVTLRGADFSGRKDRDWIVVESVLEDCKFENLRARDFCFGAGKNPSYYRGCSFDGSWIKAEIPGKATFERCTFRGVRLRKWICLEVEMIDCEFDGLLDDMVFDAEVPELHVRRLGRAKNRYIGNDFTGAELSWVSFRRGVDLTAQRLPQNDQYYVLDQDAERVVRAGLRDTVTWPDSNLKEDARRELGLALDDILRGQQQILFSAYNLDPGDSRANNWTKIVDTIKAARARIDSEDAAGTPTVTTAGNTRRELGGSYRYLSAADGDTALNALETMLREPSTPIRLVDAPGIDHFLVLGQLLAIIHGTQEAQIVPHLAIWPPASSEPATIEEYERLPDNHPWKITSFALMELGVSVRDTLAHLDDTTLPALAAEWAKINEFKRYRDAGPDDLLPILTDLVTLAREAVQADEFLYCRTPS